MNSTNEYTIKISKAENGYLLTREDIVSGKTDSLSFDEWETTLYVFPETKDVIKYIEENLK